MPRRFHKERADEILRRAIELTKEQRAGSAPEGQTLEELEEIAAAAGIDPELVRRAAREGHSASGSFWDKLLGAPPTLEYEDLVDGEIDQSAHEAIAALLHRAVPYSGTVNVAGRAFLWTFRPTQGLRDLSISITPEKGKTRIRVVERTARTKILTWTLMASCFSVFAATGGAVAGGALFGTLGGVLGGTLGMATTLLSNPIVRGMVSKQRHELADFIEQLHGVVSENIASQPQSRDLAAAREAQGLRPAAETNAEQAQRVEVESELGD